MPYDFEKFKFKLKNTNMEKGYFKIPRRHIELAGPVELASLLLTNYGEKYAVRLTLQILQATSQCLLAEQLLKATGPGKWLNPFSAGMAKDVKNKNCYSGCG